MIRDELCPSVVFDGDLIENKGKIPAEIVFEKINNISSLKLLILGNASMGKSTFARVLEALFLKSDIPVIFYECKNINDETLPNLINKSATSETVYIFDGYEEYRGDKSDIKNIVKKLKGSNSVILSSRYNPDEEDRNQNKEQKDLYFNDFIKLNLLPFSEDQINCIIKDKEGIVSESLKALLSNTMFFSMYLEMIDNDSKIKNQLDVEEINEALFIKEYFLKLWRDKSKSNKESGLLTSLEDIGRAIFKSWLNKKSILSDEIPVELCKIYEVEKGEIKSRQMKYLSFAVSIYMLRQLGRYYKESEWKEIKKCLADWLSINYRENNGEAMYYLGQLLSQKSFGRYIIGLLNSLEKDTLERINGVCIFLGYNHNVAEHITCDIYRIAISTVEVERAALYYIAMEKE